MSNPNKLLALLISVPAVIGSLILVIQAVWISYGVFLRYILNDPDMYVTEATALLLVPLAFAGLPMAFKHNAFPQVRVLRDRLPPTQRRIVELFSLLLILVVGVYYALVTGSATVRSYFSGAESKVIFWPEFVFWAPVTAFIWAFNVLVLVRLIQSLKVSSEHWSETSS